MKVTCRLGFAGFCSLLLILAMHSSCRAADANDVFAFQDYLGRDWQNEAVRVRLTPQQVQRITSAPQLVGPGQKPVPYQVVKGDDGKAAAVEFMANIKPNEKSVYQFAAGKNAETTDLKVEDTATSIRITNQFTGITLRKKLAADQAPIESVRLDSGEWVGGSRMLGLTPTNYSAKIIAQGPVYCEVECRTEFGAGSSWTLNFRLNAGEPVVVVNETMALGEKDGGFSLSLDSGDFKPDHLFYRLGLPKDGKEYGTNQADEMKPGVAFVLEPWLRWWARPEQGAVFSVFQDDKPGMLSVGAGYAGMWVDPTMKAEQRTANFANLYRDDKGTHLDFALHNGRRFWIIGSYNKDHALSILQDPEKTNYPAIPHQYLIKYGQFPLNEVKDWVLDWDSSKEQYPHLIVTKADVERYKKANPMTDEQLNAVYYKIVQPVNMWTMGIPISMYFSNGSEKVGKILVDQSQLMMQQAVDSLLYQPYLPYGAAPHHQQSHNFGLAPLVADSILDSNLISPEQRKKLLAQMAFCSYAINSPGYWSQERGYAANPNMTTTVMGYRIALGSCISSHPEAPKWVNDALAQMRYQLDNWSDSNGGWLEAPHYAMVGYDAILGAALMAHNAGINEMLFDPKMKKVALWFAKWSTPPDSRFGGYRHLPPIGNSYINEVTGEFGLIAAIWKQKDPAFASQMQWMHRQQKSMEQPGVGGGYPAIAGYRKILFDASIPETAPQWNTEFFPSTGVMMRSGSPSERETMMLLLAGGFGGWRSHYDDDSGSFTLWGKGRIIADDFGYYGAAPAEDHNLPWVAEMALPSARIFDTTVFSTTKEYDYTSGARGPWQRQVAFLKNEDPLEPNYYVVSDSFKSAAPGTWRLWFTAAKVTPNASGALIEGKDDVDTELFYATPNMPEMKVEEKTRTAGSGYRLDGSDGAMPTTQIGLIATTPTEGTMTYVLYPRLKTEKPPVITSMAEGKVLRVQYAAGTDYIFQSSTPFTWSEGTISFEGKCGMVRFRGTRMILSLGEEGKVGARGQVLESKKAARQEVDLQARLIRTGTK